jgi:hypothetical protein
MKTKVKKSTEEVFDIYTVQKQLGMPLCMILSFGYIEACNDEKIPFSSLPVDQRNDILLLRIYMLVVISEVMKSQEYRSDYKINGFLKLAMEQSDAFYKNNPDAFLFHQLNTPKDV